MGGKAAINKALAEAIGDELLEVQEENGVKITKIVINDADFASEEMKKAHESGQKSAKYRETARLDLLAQGIEEGSDEWKREWKAAVDRAKEDADEITRHIIEINERGGNGGKTHKYVSVNGNGGK
jgi:hypothetical protein